MRNGEEEKKEMNKCGTEILREREREKEGKWAIIMKIKKELEKIKFNKSLEETIKLSF